MQPGLVLRGWRDHGSCFQIRASSELSPELLTEVESEVLLLAPHHWHNTCLQLFGLTLDGLQVRGGSESPGALVVHAVTVLRNHVSETCCFSRHGDADLPKHGAR